MSLTRYALLYPVTFAGAASIRVHPDSGGAGVEQTVVLPVVTDQLYWVSGDRDTRANKSDLVRKLVDALNSATGGPWNFAATLDGATGVITITEDDDFILLWDDAATTVDPAIFGFVDATTAATSTLVAPNQAGGQWLPEAPAVFDSFDNPEHLGAVVESGDAEARGGFREAVYNRQIRWGRLPAERVQTRDAEATKPLGAFETAWVSGMGSQCPVRVYDDASLRGQGDYALYVTRSRARPWQRDRGQTIRLYEIGLDLRRSAPAGFGAEHAIDFGGTDDLLLSPLTRTVDGATRITVAMWFKGIGSNPSGEFLMAQWSASGVQRRFYLFQTGAELQFRLTATAGAGEYGETTVAGIVPDAWTHVVVSYFGGGATDIDKLKIAVDGVNQVLAYSGAIPTSIVADPVPMEIGIGHESDEIGTHWGPGRVADAALWVGVTADAAQVAELYQGAQIADLSALPTMPPPKHWWQMGGGKSPADLFPVIYDQRGGLHLTMTNQTASDIVKGDAP